MRPARDLCLFRAALSLVAILHAIATPAVACSPPSEPLFRYSLDFYFLGRALPDSVRAGHGPIQPAGLTGFLGRLFGRRVYGQRFAVERIGQPWQALLPKGTKTVILVAWGNGEAGCELIYRTGSAVWMKPGTEAAYSAQLRKKSQWVNGEPTFDVLRWGTYTGLFRPRTRADSAMRRFTPDEYLGFVEILPTATEFNRNPVAATRQLNQWAVAHPDLAEIEEARWFLKTARDAVERATTKR